jgi:hypothetical protein
VKIMERNAKTSSAKAGLSAVLANPFRGRGRGALISVSRGGGCGRRVWLCAAAGCMVVALGLLTAAAALAAEPPELQFDSAANIHPTRAELNMNGPEPPSGEKTYVREDRIEYAASESGPFTVVARGVSGTGAAGQHAPAGGLDALVKNLTPETTYYARFFAETANGGSATETLEFTTSSPSAPEVAQPRVVKYSHEYSHGGKGVISVGYTAEIETNDAETSYTFEYATKEAGPYSLFPSGATGKVSGESATTPEASFTGPGLKTTYYIRVTAENAHGRSSATTSLETESGAPNDVNVESSHITSTSAVLTGTFISEFETKWRLEYASSESGPWTTAGEGTLTEAEVKEGEGSVGPVELSGLSPGTTYQERLFVENAYGKRTSEEPFTTIGPPVVTTFATHALEGETIRVLGHLRGGFVSGEGYEAHYHVEYVSQAQFEADGWTGAVSTPETTVKGEGYGAVVELVSEALPGLKQGETYHYRFVASNTIPGDPVVEGGEETLTVPAPAPGEAPAACPNEAFRVGPSARLPDCRAYEQVTPVEKGATQDAFTYTGAIKFVGYLTGADGEHVLLHDPGVKWGSSPDPKQGNYFFSRTSKGWQMTPAKPAGEPGPIDFEPEVFNPDLTQVGFASSWQTSAATESPDVEFKVGPPGGPYQLAASIPHSKGAELVGESADGSKYVLASEDRTLAGHATGTTSGDDLYEFSEGKLRQLNVLGGSPGAPISTCGAAMPTFREEVGVVPVGYPPSTRTRSVESAVSADGSRVFFTDDCTHHLYMRVNGGETVDIGEYELIAADAQGTTLALRNSAGEVVGYDTETGRTAAPSSAEQATERELADLGIPIQHTPEAGDPFAHSRDSYFVGNVAGLPYRQREERQVYRYDSGEQMVECVSCASSFDPNPRFGAFFDGSNVLTDNNGTIEDTFDVESEGDPPGLPYQSLGGSANGDFVFFDTVSALLPQDVDGERAPEEGATGKAELGSEEYSPSSDVYEWRKNGVDGCTRVQGCLSLITTGKGGTLNEFLGTDASGRDVFFATDESLVSQDDDTASDIYDARIDGGFPPPAARPVECEGDACSTPLAAPNDLTPASATFQGAGDLPGALPEAKPKPKKAKKKTKRKRGAKRKVKRATKSARAGRAVHRFHGGAK